MFKNFYFIFFFKKFDWIFDNFLYLIFYLFNIQKNIFGLNWRIGFLLFLYFLKYSPLFWIIFFSQIMWLLKYFTNNNYIIDFIQLISFFFLEYYFLIINLLNCILSNNFYYFFLIIFFYFETQIFNYE